MNENELIERLSSVEQSVKSAHHRLDEVVDGNKSIAEILAEMKYMRRDLNSLIERVSTVEGKPMRRYDTAINGLITAVIATIISIFLK